MSIYQRIEKTQYAHFGYHTTVCVLTLDNGYQATGTAPCLGYDPEAIEESEALAQADALAKLEPIYNFLKAEESR